MIRYPEMTKKTRTPKSPYAPTTVGASRNSRSSDECDARTRKIESARNPSSDGMPRWGPAAGATPGTIAAAASSEAVRVGDGYDADMYLGFSRQ